MALPNNADLGIGITGVLGAGKTWKTVSGYTNLGNAIARRLTTDGLFYDSSYGIDIRVYLNSPFSAQLASELALKIEQQCLQDERVTAVGVTTQYNQTLKSLTIRLALTSSVGPFTLILVVNSLTVELLTIEAA